jgi:hypothetical protein
MPTKPAKPSASATTRATYQESDLTLAASPRCRCGEPCGEPLARRPDTKLALEADGQVWACRRRFLDPQRFDDEQLDSANEAHDPAYHVDHYPFPAAT